MSFLSQFSKYFSPQERETEMYSLWSAIGVNTEKAILEELEKVNTEMTDLNSFSENTLRSWLAFFLQKIPYRTTATVQVKTKLLNELITAEGGGQSWKYASTTIPIYSQLKNEDGYVYTTMQEIILNEEDERIVTAVQGRRITEQGTYNSIIKVQANNPDLSYLTVILNGKEIPEVTYQTSYDQLSFMGSWKPQNSSEDYGGTPFIHNGEGIKGQFYTVIGDGYCRFDEDGVPVEFKVGDIVVFDGISWQRSAVNNNLKPIQFADTFAIPSNGYFAYYYGGFLYIKIYSGTEVDNPEGLSYSVSYISSDGILGETKANTLTYVSNFQDSNEKNVELEVSNSKSSIAVNEPGVGKLSLYLKQRLYGSINLSSIPEYTAWFKAQPEVGDCMVLSDWEKYRRSGVYNVEGYVDVFLTDNNGDALSDEVVETLWDRISPYKDIALLRVWKFEPIENYFEFQYTSVNGEDAFNEFIKSTTTKFYNIPYLQSINSSLFESVDLAKVIDTIQENKTYSSTGLIVKGYHYRKDEVPATSYQVESYQGEMPGTGWYYVNAYSKDNDEVPEISIKLIERNDQTGLCQIWNEKDSSYSWGTHIGRNVNLTIDASLFLNDRRVEIECYWGMENEGILSIGSVYGLRRLHGVKITKVSD